MNELTAQPVSDRGTDSETDPAGGVGETTGGGAASTVLIADDERALADAYAAWLGDDHATRVAYDGADAVELLDESVDVALLDRQMPGCTGDELVRAIRERDLDCRTGLVSADKPGMDLVDVAYDAYRVKPISSPGELSDLLVTLQRRAGYDPDVKRVLALASRKADLEAHVPEGTRRESDDYAALVEEFEGLAAELPDVEEVLEREGLATTF